MKKITQKQLNAIMKEHELWLNDEGGKRAILCNLDLRGLDLSNCNLKSAHLESANLENANLRNANLENAYLRNANLENANLKNANLENVNLCWANLTNVNLEYANLGHANLYGANLLCASLENANLTNANLYNCKLSNNEMIRKGIILNKPMIGYKKCKNDIIVKLEIPKGAIVFSINNYKCRTNIAKVINISDYKNIAYSRYKNKFTYELGKTYEIKDFNLQYNVECGRGIHFFRTLKEAEEWW